MPRIRPPLPLPTRGGAIDVADAGELFGYAVLAGSGCILARWLWFSFWNYIDAQAAEAFNDRREKSRQQLIDADDMAKPFGDIAWAPGARCPVDFENVTVGAISDRAGERAMSGTDRLGNQKHSHFHPDIARPESPL